jgi:thiol-disulfide isomerase/thioredoxin
MRCPASCLKCFCAFLAVVPISLAEGPPAPSPASPAALKYSPTNPNSIKSYDEALKLLEKGHATSALPGFRKADQLDGGHCFMCELEAWDAAMQTREFQIAQGEAKTMLDNVTVPAMHAQAEFMLGKATLALGILVDGDSQFEEADASFRAALQIKPNYLDCIYEDGTALAYLKRDDQAIARFQTYLKLAGPNDLNYARVERFIERPEMARSRLAPNFRVTTLDGKTITLESLAGKVVLIDFWATWCPPCRRALPHLQKIAQEFAGQPFVLLSISLDPDEASWRGYTARNHMTWPQYRAGGFDGEIPSMFAVQGIPYTIIIDANGVLQDQYLGSEDINGKHLSNEEVEGRLKKLIARAAEGPAPASIPVLQTRNSGTTAGQP